MQNVQMPARDSADSSMLATNSQGSRNQALRDAVAAAAFSDAPALISGEVGSDNQQIARMIHNQSRRAEGPFIVVDCAALAQDRFNAELFGSSDGASDGSFRRDQGRIMSAEAGTLFLENVDALAPASQALLSRVLSAGEFRRVGGEESLSANVRLIVSTHQDLDALCQSGDFQQDLCNRLGGLHVRAPTMEDGGESFNLGDDQLGDTISVEQLGFDDDPIIHGSPGNGARATISLRERRQVAEREAITQALRESRGQVPAAAAALGISRAQLYRLIGRLRVNHRPFAHGFDGSNPGSNTSSGSNTSN